MKWLIILDPYTDKSNGIKHMHEMCHKLNSLGEEAYVAFMTPPFNGDQTQRKLVVSFDENLRNLNLNTPPLDKKYSPQQVREEFIVVYPEVLIGNPLSAKKIVRWLGNSQKTYSYSNFLSIEKDAYVLSFSKIFHEKPNYVLFNTFIDDFFYKNEKNLNKRNLDLIFHGKSSAIDVYENTFLVDRYWPKDRKQLALLLKNCRFFYTTDSLSNINAEAVVAGAVPVFLKYDPWTQQEIDSFEIGPYPKGNLIDIKNNVINSYIDENKFYQEREEFIEKIKFYQKNWQKNFELAVNDIKKYFS